MDFLCYIALQVNNLAMTMAISPLVQLHMSVAESTLTLTDVHDNRVFSHTRYEHICCITQETHFLSYFKFNFLFYWNIIN